MDIDENEIAVLEWVNTFNLSKECTTLAHLSDGIIICKILSEIVPNSFNVDSLKSELSINNINNLLNLIRDYYRFNLQKRIDITCINAKAIASDQDKEEILNLIELVIGVAVMCDDKAIFIEKIFGLNIVTQNILKEFIQQVMSRTEEYEEDGDDKIDNNLSKSEDLIQYEEMTRHLQEERQKLINAVQDLENKNNILQGTVHKLNDQITDIHNDKVSIESNERNIDIITSKVNILQNELDDTKRELDTVTVENDNLRINMKNMTAKLESNKELIETLKLEKQFMADELDVTRENSAKLLKSEEKVEKYQKRLEELNVLKKQNKEITDKMDEYLDQIDNLESANKKLEISTKTIPTLNKMIEQYKEKAIELEKLKLDAVLAKEMQQHEVERLTSELELSIDARRFLEDEMSNIKIKSEDSNHDESKSSNCQDIFEMETVTSLKEKIRKLEKIIQSFQDNNTDNNNIQNLTENLSNDNNIDITLLKSELEDITREKNIRESMLLDSKKLCSETTQELHKTNKALQDYERQLELLTKETAHKLIVSSNEVKTLEEIVRNKESTIVSLTQDKEKIETYSKQYFSTFRDKYMAAITKIKQEKNDLQEKLAFLEAKYYKTIETTRKEERLILSSMYELGVRIIDKNIQKY